MHRRRLLAGAAGLAAAATAGCLDGVSSQGPGMDDTTPVAPPDDTDAPDDTPSGWTADTNCDGMHDSVVKVKWERDRLAENYAPIHFSELTDAEQSILRTVVEEGGYATCDASDAFVDFTERVGDHREEQADGGDGPDVVHLEYRGRYYGLYVERTDIVFSA